jgi:hypothetical protein
VSVPFTSIHARTARRDWRRKLEHGVAHPQHGISAETSTPNDDPQKELQSWI